MCTTRYNQHKIHSKQTLTHKPETRNPKPETRDPNPKPETRIRNLTPDTRNAKPEMQDNVADLFVDQHDEHIAVLETTRDAFGVSGTTCRSSKPESLNLNVEAGSKHMAASEGLEP